MKSLPTQLGKFLRKIRIDRGEFLRDMAAKLGVTISFLSSVENGKKNMPSEWISKLPVLYQFSGTVQSEFDAAVAESEKGIDVRFESLSMEDKKLSVAFARKIKALAPKDRELLQEILA